MGAISKKARSQQVSQDTRFTVREAYRKAILTFELETNPENEQIHHIMKDQLLEFPDREHCAYVSANEKDITKEPEKSYIHNLR
jgi:hypothetical protein